MNLIDSGCAQKTEMRYPLSSPIRRGNESSFDHEEQDNDVNVIDDLHRRQQQRSNRLFRPMSSPIRSQDKGITRGSFNHVNHQNRDGRVIGTYNRKNRHDKMREVRERHREDKLLMNREKMGDLQDVDDYQRKYEEEARKFEIDLERLINDEEELEKERQETQAADKRARLEEEELEEYLRMEQQELEEMISQMDLGS